MEGAIIETFEDADLQISRAKELLNEMKVLIQSTETANVSSFRNESDNPLSLKLSYKDEPLPRKLLVISKDIFNNLVSPLDHIAVKIFTRKDKGKIYFPVRKNQLTLREELNKFHSDIPGIKNIILDEIKAYKDGNYSLWAIRELNNTVKHKQFFSIDSKVNAVQPPTITGPGLFIGGNIFINESSSLNLDNTKFVSIEGRDDLTVHNDGFVSRAIFIKDDYPFGGTLLTSALSSGIEAVSAAILALKRFLSIGV